MGLWIFRGVIVPNNPFANSTFMENRNDSDSILLVSDIRDRLFASNDDANEVSLND